MLNVVEDVKSDSTSLEWCRQQLKWDRHGLLSLGNQKRQHQNLLTYSFFVDNKADSHAKQNMCQQYGCVYDNECRFYYQNHDLHNDLCDLSRNHRVEYKRNLINSFHNQKQFVEPA